MIKDSLFNSMAKDIYVASIAAQMQGYGENVFLIPNDTLMKKIHEIAERRTNAWIDFTVARHKEHIENQDVKCESTTKQGVKAIINTSILTDRCIVIGGETSE